MPTEAEMEKSQAKELSKMKFERIRSDSESSYCIETPSSSKSQNQNRNRKRARSSKSGRSSTSSSTSARSSKVKKVEWNSRREDDNEIENFLEESEVETNDEDESSAKRIKIDPKNIESNFAEKTKGQSSGSWHDVSRYSEGNESDEQDVEARNFNSTRLHKLGPASAKKKLQGAIKQHGCGSSTKPEQKSSRPGPASKKPGYCPTKATFPNSTTESDSEESSENETTDSGEVIFNRRSFSISLPPKLVYILVKTHDIFSLSDCPSL